MSRFLIDVRRETRRQAANVPHLLEESGEHVLQIRQEQREEERRDRRPPVQVHLQERLDGPIAHEGHPVPHLP